MHGKTVKAKWVRIKKESEDRPEVRRRLVGQQLGYGERFDSLLACAPSCYCRLQRRLSVAAEKALAISVLGVKCLHRVAQAGSKSGNGRFMAS